MMKSRVKKIILTFLVLMTVMMMSAATVHAADTAAVRQAKKAYATFLAKKGYMSRVMKSYVSSGDTVDFQLAYIDSDRVPELLVKYNYANVNSKRASYGYVYMFKSGKVRFYETVFNPYGYYKKKNLCVEDSREIKGQRCFLYVRPKEKHSTCSKLYKIYRSGKPTEYHACIVNTDEGCITPECTAKKFKSILTKMVGATRLTKFAPVRYTKANRKRILGY